MTFATNQEKLSSSVFRSIVRAVRTDPELKEKLGDAIRAQPEWYFNGDPHVKGHVSSTGNPLMYGSSSRQQISQLQGNIDVSFRVKGSKGTFGFSPASLLLTAYRCWHAIFYKHSKRKGRPIYCLSV